MFTYTSARGILDLGSKGMVLFSQNKGIDQLWGYVTADLRFHFPICIKQFFS